MARTLRTFLDDLERAGELIRVTECTSPMLEIAAIADRQARRDAPSTSAAGSGFDPNFAHLGGSALLFENVEGSDFPVAINVFGSCRRMELALGATFPEIAARLEAIVQPKPPKSLREAVALAKKFSPLLRIGPKRVRKGVCQQVVNLAERGEVDLFSLPLIKCWPSDGDPRAVGIDFTPQQSGTSAGEGRYITFAGMHTVHVDDADASKPASHNIGMYRAQLIDQTRLAMHWHIHHDGAAHWRSWKSAGHTRMPIAICFGGEAVLPYAATAPLPPGMSELLMAGLLNGKGIHMVRAATVPLRVPANSEIVIEGWVSTECGPVGWEPSHGALGPGAVYEGPFGDHTGYYSMPDRYPIMEVTAITHRHDAVFPATVVGLPPQEDYWLGKATERMFLPLLQVLIPDIRDYHLPRFGCFHNCAFVQIRKQYALQARRVMHAIWGAGQMAWTKLIVVVDEDTNVHDERDVLRAIARRVRFDRDLERVNGPLDILDHAAPRLGAGGKLGIDATETWPGEEVNGVSHSAAAPQPRPGAVREEISDLVGWKSIADASVPEWGAGRCVVLGIDKHIAGDGARAIAACRARDVSGVDLVLAVDAGVNGDDYEDTWFHVCANFDPSRDMHEDGAFLGIDATRKLPGDERNGQPVRVWPPKIRHDADVLRRAGE